MPERRRPMSGDAWTWTITVSDWPIGSADYDLTPEEALNALTSLPAPEVETGPVHRDPRTPRGRELT